MNTSSIVKWGGLAALAYFLYSKLQTNVGAPVASVLADIWLSLTLPPAMVLQGNILLPDGTLIPLQNSDVKQGPDGNVYLNLGGTFFRLYPSDANGNWPATRVA